MLINRDEAIVRQKRRKRLKDCPVGLFYYGDTLCMKTEYGNNEGRIDAFIVSSGEFFWGKPPQTIASQREQMVTPCNIVALPTVSVSEEMVERARQAWLEKASDYELLEVSIRAALEAALGPLPAPLSD